MRFEPPTSVSGASCFSEDVSIGGINFEKNLGFVLMIFVMHKDSNEWINPEAFIPDRFDSNSAFALRPDGSKRNS